MKKITIYTGDYCPYCIMAKSLLKKENISFSEINISGNNNLKEEMIKKSSGCKTIPQIFADDDHLGGYDDLKELHSNKKLNTILNK